MHTQAHDTVPYCKLRPSPRNVRAGVPLDDGIPQLAATIEAEGVLQNLLVTEHGRGRRLVFEVEGGRRRHAALDLLFSQGKIKKDYPVPVKRTTVARATCVSLVENLHEALHPVDELAAFRRLIDEEGRSIEEIALTFRVAPIVVQRRLKLANVAPRFLDLFRSGEVDLEHLMALAITDDHERQCAVWDGLPEYSRSARSLRDALTETEVDAARDPVARYVGLAAYEKAGGPVRRDLFIDDHEGFMLDAALLHRLAQAKLDKRVAALQAEGWEWVEARIRLDYSERTSFQQMGTVRRELSKAEAKKIARLEQAIEALRVVADSEDEDAASDEQIDQLDALEAELRELDEELQIPDPQQQAYAGAIVTIGKDGKAETLRGLIRPADKRRAQADDDATTSADEVVTRGPLSDRLARNLSAHFTAGLRTSLARSPHVALAVLVETLIKGHLHEGDVGSRTLRLRMESADLRTYGEDINESAAQQELEQLQQKVTPRIPSQDRLQWLLEQSNDDLLYLLAIYLAPALQAVTGGATVSDEALAIARAASLDMADYWKPTADSYLRHVPKALIVESVRDGVSPEAAAILSDTKKKALMVTTAAAQLAPTRWLPAILRT